MSLDDCRIIELPQHKDPRGNLSFVESNNQIPFAIERIFYIYDVPGGSDRGGHAHKDSHELIISMSGSFDVTLDDGKNKKKFHLARSYYGLYICPMIWREIDNFSSGSVLMVLASNKYTEDDYHRNYDDFMRARWVKE
jgi:dTDP-4-dehydrorhamnose 3,5-epimerase-like enzyme